MGIWLDTAGYTLLVVADGLECGSITHSAVSAHTTGMEHTTITRDHTRVAIAAGTGAYHPSVGARMLVVVVRDKPCSR